ncbi:MAG: hypothetical protein ACK5X3_24475 [Pseudomonadota bacterium]
MTPEELDEARVRAERIRRHRFAARLAREGWTPPEPVDPDVLAFREWGERRFGVNTASAYRLGDCDDTAIADAYLAGASMAREQERERAGPLVEFVEDHSRRLDGVGARALLKESDQ